MRVIHVVRKPLSESSVAANVLEHGTGTVNVDACRVGTATVSTHSRGSNTAYPKMVGHKTIEESDRTARQDNVDRTPRTGRWPANLILEHLEGCRKVGRVKVAGRSGHGTSTIVRRSGVHQDAGGHQTVGRVQPCFGYSDAEGKEEVDAWICEPGCPVAELDRETLAGGMHSAGSAKGAGGWDSPGGWGFIGKGEYGNARVGDAGGASRFYKQVGGEQ